MGKIDHKEIVSVIIPAYNSADTIVDCLNSILDQSFGDFVIYIVDDFSTDNTWETIVKESGKDVRIKVYRNEYNMGPSASRNKALEECKGEWVCFIDSDDYIDRRYLENLIDNSDNADLVIGSFLQVDESGVQKSAYIVTDDYCTSNVNDALDKAYGGTDDLDFIYNLCCNKLYRRRLFSKERFPAGRLQEDAFIMAHLIYNIEKRVAVAPQAIYYYVDHTSSISHRAQKGESDLSRRIDLVNLYEDHIVLHRSHSNRLYKRSRANLMNNIIAIFRLHYSGLYSTRKEKFRELKRTFSRHYIVSLTESNPHLSKKLLATWFLFFLSPKLYLKYI